jgi:hypothetical protein
MGNYLHGYVVATTTQSGVNITAVQENVTYYWQIAAIDPGLKQSSWSAVQTMFLSAIAPTLPVVQTPSNGTLTSLGNVAFDWSDSTDSISGVKNYELQLSTDSVFTVVNYSSSTVPSQSTLYGISSAWYFWRVRSVDNDLNYTAWTSTYNLLVDTIAPINAAITVTDVFISSITINPANLSATDELLS